ncbi:MULTISPECIES: tyrosine-type recombinase/integrase [Paraburkholderia]|uniref:tyrosine-type recombinase/integrase n=1 Tax=Paraburkholderia TaxID=1822464 RepID=UPI001909F7AF|nr:MULTISPECIES: tyrosine-type recombinase/integrase [Paraburkholderia]MBK5091788.1 site-specific integrase [Burkholderia sp. R-69927]MBK3844495.1 site-specific integrase [Paraburkholderia aspalathi]MCX4177821.1 tyrosine-type recombinase/integrase [Paraburkholderia madseniana]MDQ6465808.1 site-specific integrase [Paraburkholderia madseniana]CAE6871967.1 Tyrosine recombinase XerC [Paraburkholderia aspalathi]
MKPHRSNALGRSLVRFFQEYLPTLRGMSQHTIHGYRDAVVLFLRYLAEDSGRPVDRLDLSDINAVNVSRFLTFIEEKRGNSINTRNARLAAIHTFSRFLANDYPEHMVEWQRVLALPFKRGATQAPIEYLEADEVKAVLCRIDRSTEAGRRDYALFAVLFNTGARVQEILDLRRCDVRAQSPYHVRLTGKGSKTRLCPIWAQTARLLQELSRLHPDIEDGENILFRNSHGGKLTRFGVRYLLHKYVTAAAEDVETLRTKRIHPHSLRHGTAIALLKAGVDFATISQWLGHSSLNTTMIYARADMDVKRQALAQVFPDVLATPPTHAPKKVDLVDWLRQL